MFSEKLVVRPQPQAWQYSLLAVAVWIRREVSSRKIGRRNPQAGDASAETYLDLLLRHILGLLFIS